MIGSPVVPPRPVDGPPGFHPGAGNVMAPPSPLVGRRLPADPAHVTFSPAQQHSPFAGFQANPNLAHLMALAAAMRPQLANGAQRAGDIPPQARLMPQFSPELARAAIY